MKLLPQKFYDRDPSLVAKELLGKLLVRKLKGKLLSGMITETEAYYGEKDPASRAYKGKNKISEMMYAEPGRVLVYMVHANWLLNLTCLPKGVPGAVLIRAIKPVRGIELMKKNRGFTDLKNLTNGPGKLTKALAIDKSLHGTYVFSKNSPLQVYDFRKVKPEEIKSGFRIGVSRDLPIPLRFYL